MLQFREMVTKIQTNPELKQFNFNTRIFRDAVNFEYKISIKSYLINLLYTFIFLMSTLYKAIPKSV